MILTITIISGIMFLIHTLACIISNKDEGSTNVIAYGTICILSIWYSDTTVGIIFCCIINVLTIITIIKVANN